MESQTDNYAKHDKRVFYTGLIIVILICVSLATYLFVRLRSNTFEQLLKHATVQDIYIRYSKSPSDIPYSHSQVLGELQIDDETFIKEFCSVFEQYRYRLKQRNSHGGYTIPSYDILIQISTEIDQELQQHMIQLNSQKPDEVVINNIFGIHNSSFDVLHGEEVPSLFDALMQFAPFPWP